MIVFLNRSKERSFDLSVQQTAIPVLQGDRFLYIVWNIIGKRMQRGEWRKEGLIALAQFQVAGGALY